MMVSTRGASTQRTLGETHDDGDERHPRHTHIPTTDFLESNWKRKEQSVEDTVDETQVKAHEQDDRFKEHHLNGSDESCTEHRR